MANFLGVDHKILAAVTLGVTSSVAVLSTVQLWRVNKKKKKENVYETQRALHEYLLFHYGEPSEVLRFNFGPKDSLDFPKRCADLCLKYFELKEGVPNRALDIGCAVGRSSFELTHKFHEVLGMDYSHSFVDACNVLKEQGQMAYNVITEGQLSDQFEAIIDPSLDRSRAHFKQGDACNLPLDLGQFGCVLAANLICRLHRPQGFLDRLASLVAAGGILVLTSPYTFMTEYTPKENWIGAYKDESGNDLSAFEGLKRKLSPFFELVTSEDMSFLIRETARKHQWTVAHGTVWRRILK